ncbi:hypothetical protein [Roseisolibacter sp. H3M3-2]|uniref:hypothetical protein n=1 Tax=Roseisolibacter sp. H3M3-2 TaxID=3031323 RepID=UPI0023DAEC71|nr:hypothetical protein [Roseisolibacter sp. H3M3-2]MDF1506439.1 hypothetical protein [Roseisolibacter sp. H3M3-2]
MGTKRPQTIGDYARFGLDVGVRCRACRRTAVFDAAEVMKFFMLKKWSMKAPVDASRFRCACGSREVETIAVQVDCRPKPLPARVPLLTPLYVKQM